METFDSFVRFIYFSLQPGCTYRNRSGDAPNPNPGTTARDRDADPYGPVCYTISNPYEHLYSDFASSSF
jgi:hypothetical protein